MTDHDHQGDEQLRVSVECGVLAAAMLGPKGHDAILALDPAEFSVRRHQLIAAAIQSMLRKAIPDDPDWMSVGIELDARGQLSGPGGVGGAGFLSAIVSGAPIAAAYHGWEYAAKVRDAYRADLAKFAARDLARMSEGGSLDERLAAHTAALSEIPLALDDSAGEDLPTIADLFEKKFEHRWLVPGLLHRRERVVITAAEGVGKSVSLSTWAACLAAGLHPFTGAKLERSYRVLMLDAENDEEQTQQRLQWIGERINQLDGEMGWGTRIFHQIRPEGFDIVGRDRAWFMSCLAKTSPDLVTIGPAYKAMGAAKTNDDAAVLALFNVLDEARVKFDTALMIEAHAGHSKDADGARELRPFGSSVWLRWPEVGIALQRNKDLDPGEVHAMFLDVKHWRGSRGTRDWPDQLQRGRDGQLPWHPVRPDYVGGFDPINRKWK